MIKEKLIYLRFYCQSSKKIIFEIVIEMYLVSCKYVYFVPSTYKLLVCRY